MKPPYSLPFNQLTSYLFDHVDYSNLWRAAVFRLANFAPSENFAIFSAVTGLGSFDAGASRTDHCAFNSVRPLIHLTNLTLNKDIPKPRLPLILDKNMTAQAVKCGCSWDIPSVDYSFSLSAS